MTNTSSAKYLWRLNKDGVMSDYGPLVVGNLEGISFVCQDWEMDRLGLPYTVVEEVPEFLLNFTLDVRCIRSQIIVRPLEIEDIAPLGMALSKIKGGYWVAANHNAHWIQTWDHGAASEQRIYRDMPIEEIKLLIKRSKF